MRTIPKRLLALALVVVMITSAGCAGWGSDGPVDGNQSDENGGDLEETQNDTNTSESDSDGGTNSDADDSTESDGAPDDSGDSSDETPPDQSDDESGAEDSDGSGSSDGEGSDPGDDGSSDGDSSSDSDSESDSDSDQQDSKDSDDSKDSEDSDSQKDTDDDPRGTLTVTVEDENGEPVGNVEVSGIGPDAEIYSGTTDENGQLTMDLPDGDYEFHVTTSDTDYSDSSEESITMDGSDQSLTLTVQSGGENGATPDTHPLSVSVQDHNDEPVEGASVSVVTADGGEDVASGTTDSGGTVTFSVPNGEYDVIVEHDDVTGDTATRVTVDGAETSADLTLNTSDRKATGVVKVVDQNGDPVEGEPVTLWPPGTVEEEATESRETNADGEVVIELAAGEPEDVAMYTVEVRDQEKSLGIMSDVHAGVQEVVFEVDTSRAEETERTLAVTVVDQNGNPLEGASIHATGPVLSNGVAHEPSGETDADGIATMTAYDGEYDVEVQYDGDTTHERITVDGDTDATIEVDTSEPEPEGNTVTSTW